MSNKKGFTMVELLIVLVIIGILAAVAAPIYLAQTRRAKASEAVAVISQMRQAEREYFTKHNSYRTVAAGDLANEPEAASAQGLAINVGVPQYFCNDAYSVGTATTGRFTSPAAADFVIAVDGGVCVGASGTDTFAIHEDDINGSISGGVTTGQYMLEMDNSGRIFVSYDGGTSWSAW